MQSLIIQQLAIFGLPTGCHLSARSVERAARKECKNMSLSTMENRETLLSTWESLFKASIRSTWFQGVTSQISYTAGVGNVSDLGRVQNVRISAAAATHEWKFLKNLSR
jgi:hypothetical protein